MQLAASEPETYSATPRSGIATSGTDAAPVAPSSLNPMDSLREEHKAIVELLEVMKQEQTQLLEADIDKLDALTAEKSRIVAQMSELASCRHRALQAEGFDPCEQSMPAWLEKNADASAKETWEEVLNIARSAKEINRVNGMLINKHMLRTQSAIKALHMPPPGGNFYGPNGQSTMKASSRRLVIG